MQLHHPGISRHQRQPCRPAGRNLHVHVTGFHHHTPVQGNDAPLGRSALKGAITSHRLPNAPVDGRHDNPPAGHQAPFRPGPERPDAGTHLSRHFPALARIRPMHAPALGRTHGGFGRQTGIRGFEVATALPRLCASGFGAVDVACSIPHHDTPI